MTKKKTKILRIISRMNIGGPAIHVNILHSGLNNDHFESVMVMGKISTDEGDMSYLLDQGEKRPVIINILQREINIFNDLKTFLEILRIIHRIQPDIIHSHTAKAGTVSRTAAVLYRIIFGNHIKVLHTFHGHVFEGYFNRIKSLSFIWIERILARFTHVIIAISDSQKREIANRYKIKPIQRIETIPLGFNLVPFLNHQFVNGTFRKEHHLDDDVILIGIIGRLVPIKNHMMFLKAARQFVMRNPEIPVRFVIIGDGELRSELETYCRQNGLAERVTFCGWIRQMPAVYADLDVVALTSLNEGTPVSIIEAMASAIPVIATNVGGVKDLLGLPPSVSNTGHYHICSRGVLCEKNDVQGFVHGLEYLIRNRINGDNPMLQDAREYVKTHFNQERLVQDMASLYEELVGHPTE